MTNSSEKFMPRIGVAQLGGPGWPRFALTDEQGRYWAGGGWTPESLEARLFADEPAAAEEYSRVVRTVRAGEAVTEYTATVTVRVVGAERYDPQRLAAYLAAACRLRLEPGTLPGLVPDAAVLVEIDWGRLKERSDQHGDEADLIV